MSIPRLILDVDTGHDDAVAIMMAAHNPAIDLCAITVTAGNQTLDKTLVNTLHVCSALSIDVPVYAGMSRPLLSPLVTASKIHGESGLDGPVFPPCNKKEEKEHAVVFLVNTIMEHPAKQFTIVATGPLTNIAMALRLEPTIAHKIARLLIMGGSMTQGNVTAQAEFNIHADPEAASIVFDSGIMPVMVGLDVTRALVLTRERLDLLSQIKGPAASIFSASMEHYMAACLQYIGESPAMHDPLCVALAADPSLCQTKKYFVGVECSGALTRGRTVVDLSGVSQKAPNAEVALTIDEKRFWAMLEATLQRY